MMDQRCRKGHNETDNITAARLSRRARVYAIAFLKHVDNRSTHFLVTCISHSTTYLSARYIGPSCNLSLQSKTVYVNVYRRNMDLGGSRICHALLEGVEDEDKTNIYEY